MAAAKKAERGAAGVYSSLPLSPSYSPLPLRLQVREAATSSLSVIPLQSPRSSVSENHATQLLQHVCGWPSKSPSRNQHSCCGPGSVRALESDRLEFISKFCSTHQLWWSYGWPFHSILAYQKVTCRWPQDKLTASCLSAWGNVWPQEYSWSSSGRAGSAAE